MQVVSVVVEIALMVLLGVVVGYFWRLREERVEQRKERRKIVDALEQTQVFRDG